LAATFFLALQHPSSAIRRKLDVQSLLLNKQQVQQLQPEQLEQHLAEDDNHVQQGQIRPGRLVSNSTDSSSSSSSLIALGQAENVQAQLARSELEFWDFGELVDLAKGKAKSIMSDIKEVTENTIDNMKPIIADKVKEFKGVLLKTKDQCVAAIAKFKDQLVQGVHQLKTVAVAELPKYWKQLEGMRQKMGEAKDALVAQLMTGSLTGAAEVMNQHLGILMAEAKTASGGLKDQLQDSIRVLKGEAAEIVQSTLDDSGSNFAEIFGDTMKRSTVLVNQLLGEVKAEIKRGADKARKIAEDEAKRLAGDIKDSVTESIDATIDKVQDKVGDLSGGDAEGTKIADEADKAGTGTANGDKAGTAEGDKAGSANDDKANGDKADKAGTANGDKADKATGNDNGSDEEGETQGQDEESKIEPTGNPEAKSEEEVKGGNRGKKPEIQVLSSWAPEAPETESTTAASALSSSAAAETATTATTTTTTTKAAAASLLGLSLRGVPTESLKAQLQELEEASDELANAAKEAASALAERLVEAAASLGDRVGQGMREIERADEVQEWKRHLRHLQEAVVAAIQRVSERLQDLAGEGSLGRMLATKHGVADDLEEEVAALKLAEAKVDAAKAALSAAIGSSTLTEIGQIKAKIFRLKGSEQEAAKESLAAKEQELDQLREAASEAAEQAAQSLEVAASLISVSRGRVKSAVMEILGLVEADSALAMSATADLEAVNNEVEDVWSIAVDLGIELRGALAKAQEALRPLSELVAETSEMGRAVTITIGDSGGELIDVVVTSRAMALEEANKALQRSNLVAADLLCDRCEMATVVGCCLEWMQGAAEIAPDAVNAVPLSRLHLRVRFEWQEDLEPALVHYICQLRGLSAKGRADFATRLREQGIAKLADLQETDASGLLPEDSSRVAHETVESDREAAQAQHEQIEKKSQNLMDKLSERLVLQLPNTSYADQLHQNAIDRALEWERLQSAQGIMEGLELSERQLIDRHGLLRGMLIGSAFNGETLDVAVKLNKYYDESVLVSKVVLQPQESTTDFAQEATSKEEESEQERVVKSFGFSSAKSSTKGDAVSASVGGRGWGFSASLSTAVSWSNSKSNSRSSQQNSTRERTSQSTEHYYAKSRYILEPRQLLSIPLEMLVATAELQESFEALVVEEEDKEAEGEEGEKKEEEALKSDAEAKEKAAEQKVAKKRETVGKHGEDEVEIDAQAASDFLFRFGSHICPRVMLGGWWRITSTVTSSASTDSIAVKQLASETIEETMAKEREIEVQASASGWGVSVSGGYKKTDKQSSSDSKSKSEGESQAKRQARESSVIEVHQEWKGGCSGMGPERWRESLKGERNSNWKLVDRYLDHCVGLWTFAPPRLQPAARSLCIEWATKVMAANETVAGHLCRYRSLKLVTDALSVHREAMAPKYSAIITKQNGFCLDHDTRNNKIYTKVCQPGERQQWLFEGDRLKSEANDRCLTIPAGGLAGAAVSMLPCEYGNKRQLWFFDGQGNFKSQNTDQCLQASLIGSGEVTISACHGRGNQRWAQDGKDGGADAVGTVILSKMTDSDTCMTYKSVSEIRMDKCKRTANQKWFFDKGLLKTNQDDRCLDAAGGLHMAPCQSLAKSQLWYFTKDGALKSGIPEMCMDYDYKKGNLYMHSCHGFSNQVFFFAGEGDALKPSSRLLKTRQIDSCMDYPPSTGNVYMHSCHKQNNQQWYFDNGWIRTMRDDKCLEYANDKNVVMRACSPSKNQKWYFTPSEELKTQRDGLCLDVSLSSQNVYMHPCHGGQNQKWYFAT